MSSVDAGDAIELTFTTATGADVASVWLDPDGATADGQAVSEAPPGSGKFPATFLPTRAGTWTALFTASGAATAVERYYVRANSATGPAPLATIGDVTDQFGVLSVAQEGLAGGLLRAASKMIRARFPAVDTLITAGRLDPDLVALAATNMVLRVLRNPGGLRSETIGPFSRAFDTTHAAGLLVLSSDEMPLLSPTVTVSTAAVAVGTIMLRPGLAPPPYGIRRGWV